LKVLMVAWMVISAFTAGIFQKIPLDHAIKKIDLLLEEEEMAFVFLPLKSGEAMLVKNAYGETALVNTGGPSTAKQLKEWLDRLGIQKIDKILITNNDKNYTANLPWLINQYHTNQLITGDGQLLKKRNIRINSAFWDEGERYEILPELTVDVLSKYKGALTLSFKYGNLRLLYMASDDKTVVRKLEAMSLKDFNVLKMADFAAENSPSTSFLKNVDPQAAIIFHRKGTTPNQKLLERLYNLWIDIYQTDKAGMIAIKCDTRHYEIITF
jgi:competence protein ComEC